MTRKKVPLRVGDVTDWSGVVLPKIALEYLRPGCCVRVIVENLDTGWTQGVYFDIYDVKSDHYWGECTEVYLLDEKLGMKNGDKFVFKQHHISEIPMGLGYQPKWYCKKMEKELANSRSIKKKYTFTGVR